MFTVALFILAKCPSTEVWAKKMRYIYTIENYSPIKRNKIGLFGEIWMDLETVIHTEVRSRKPECKQEAIQKYKHLAQKAYCEFSGAAGAYTDKGRKGRFQEFLSSRCSRESRINVTEKYQRFFKCTFGSKSL